MGENRTARRSVGSSMQVDDTPWGKIEVDQFRLQLLTDPYCSRILAFTSKRPACAQELSQLLDIPIAMCYRRIGEMEKAGLLQITERFLNRKGKRVNIYKAMVKVAKIEFAEGRWLATVEMLGGPQYHWEDEEIFSNGS